mgnify:CR=1 FL=1
MDILSILTEIINNPNAKRNYVRLSDYYAKNNLIHENEVVETIIKELPKPVLEGINIQVNNYAIEGKAVIKIITNELTFNKNKNKNYTILIQKNDYANYVDFILDKPFKELFIEKSSLFEGVNVIRLLDNELNSISERVVYNVTENNTKLNITSTLKTKESLNIKASIPNKIGGVIAMFGSLVILLTIPYTNSSEIRSIREQLKID